MEKATVYLTTDEAQSLRVLSARTGRSQSALIRDGVGRVIGSRPERRFHSLGKGDGRAAGAPTLWPTDDLFDRLLGRSDRT